MLGKALELVEGCKCDSSCYNCLRNYYNQKIHDQLNRHAARDFLKDWLGEPQPMDEEDLEAVVEERVALATRYPKAFVKITEAAS